MYYNKLKVFVFLGFMTFLFQACSENESLETPREEQAQIPFAERQDKPDSNPDERQTIPLQWMELFVKIDRYAEGMRPNSTARALAYINLAAYETAIPAIRDLASNSGKIPGFKLRNRPPNDINIDVALNACYADVMEHFLINTPQYHMAKISELEDQILTSFQGRRSSNQEINRSKEWGETIAAQIIEYAQTDSEAEAQILDPQPTSYIPPTGDGYWTFSAEPERALFPYWGKVRTFIIAPEETTTITPIEYSENTASLYYTEMKEVYNANNNARDEDGEALWIAEFWSDDVTGITFSPPARQISIANQLIENNDLRTEEALLLYLKIGFALNDAAATAWKYKYDYMVMRPSVFIQEFMDPNYQTNLYRLIPWPNPTFPGYPSGHSCFASAAGGVFIDFFGNDSQFTDRSHEGRTEFRGAARTYDNLGEMAEENAFSRIPLGVHVRMDCTEGIRLGYEISNAINNYDLRKVRRDLAGR